MNNNKIIVVRFHLVPISIMIMIINRVVKMVKKLKTYSADNKKMILNAS